MRRPLADAGLFFVLIIILIQLFRGRSYPDLSRWDSRTITVEGTLVKTEYSEKDNDTRVIMYINAVDADFSLPSPGYMLCCYMDNPCPGISLGSRVRFRGRLHVFEPAYNPGNFNSLQYNDIFHISASMSGVKSVEILSQSDSLWWKFRNALCDIRHTMSKLCDITFIDDDSALAKAMLLGDKSSMSSELKKLYSQNGIAHILAISGLHISLIGGVLYKLLRKLGIPVWLCSVFAILLMTVYGLICGMAASAARAIIMFSMKMLANLFRRTFDMQTALVVSAVLILIEQPKYIFYSGFLFSFGALIGVTAVLPCLKHLFPGHCGTGLCLNLTTLPLHLHNYFYFPFLSVLLNLYVIPLMSVLIVLMFIALLFSALYLPAGQLVSYPVHLILSVYEYSCRLGNLLPFCKAVSGDPGVYRIALYCIMLTIVCILSTKIVRGLIYPLLGFCLILLTMNLNYSLTLTAVDVGQGDSLLLSDNRSFSVLVDAGSSTVDEAGTYRISPFLLANGISELDAVFISHLDDDHYNALATLIADSSISSPNIGCIYFSSATASEHSDKYEYLCALAEEKSIAVNTITAGDVLQKGQLSIYCLYPTQSCKGTDTNAESMVLYATYCNTGILLTGDLEGKGEEWLTEFLTLCSGENSYGCNYHFANGQSAAKIFADTRFRILKVAHHGSGNSTSVAFLDAYKPDLALISAGRGNSYNHPHPELIRRLSDKNIPFYSTKEHGAVSVRVTGRSISVSGYLKENP